MATDVVPALNEAIQASFKGYVLKDRRIATISKRIRDGTATFVDAHDYAERLGENLSRALVNNLTADRLPDGRLYYNIAQRTVVPGLQENYDLANVAASDIQDIIFASEGIGIKAAKADFPEERIQGLIDKMTAEGITLERAIIWLQEPIINNSEAFVDDFIKENAGKLTFALNIPILLEEGMATMKGNKLAKSVLSPQLAKKVAKTNRLGFATYLCLAVGSGVGVYLATKVRDAIVHGKSNKENAVC